MARDAAENATEEQDRQYHIGLGPGDVEPWILLVGDPARAGRVAERFDSVRLQRVNREYATFTGVFRGLPLTVLGTGIGADNTEIAVLELLECEPRPTIIRVGSSGAFQKGIDIGDVVVSTGAVRLESTSLGFVDEGYPAIAHHEVVLALISAAESVGVRYHTGLTASAAGFYGVQGREHPRVKPRHPDVVERLSGQRVVNMEMESSLLFTLGSLTGVRTGCVCAVFANRIEDRFIAPEQKLEAEERAIIVGLEAIGFLARMDAEAGDRPFHLPPLAEET